MTKETSMVAIVASIIIIVLIAIIVRDESILRSVSLNGSGYNTGLQIQNQTNTVQNGQTTNTQTTKYIFTSATSNPYPNNGSMIVGGPLYLAVFNPIGADGMIKTCTVWNKNGGADILNGNIIYYQPDCGSQPVTFGQSSGKDPQTFISALNAKIAKDGYAIVNQYNDGGPLYTYYAVANY